jgi:hypothetical protein
LALVACLLVNGPADWSSWGQAPPAFEQTATQRATFYVGISALAAAAVALSEREREEKRQADRK